ncbi:GntR family transcriptional regulator [Kribbella sp. NPDC050281]|uniref:GntR family transcriptional regulator n=1 Tax=Kribbella sp. NPDC050281 TaxID=3155515 RepID=UPI0034004A57
MTVPMAAGRGPKYHRIADTLRAEIQSGELEPGKQLPAETALTSRFGVALPTLRQAIGILRAEGLIESRHGIGTFVKEARRRQRRSRNRYGRARDDQQLLSADFEHRIVFAGREPAPPYVTEAMEIESGTEVVVRRRHLHDKTTGQLEEIGASYLPVDIAGGTFLEQPTVVPKALFLCMEDLSGQQYTHARDAWVSRLPTAGEADIFNLAPGAPVLHVTHTARAAEGNVLEISESIWPADRVMFIDEYEIPEHGQAPEARSDI